MTLSNNESILILAMIGLGTTLWMLFKPTPVKVKKNSNRRTR